MKILLIAGNTSRSRTYAQYLSSKKYIVEGLFYGFNSIKYIPPKLNSESKKFFKKQNFIIPNLEIDIEKIFKKKKWIYKYVDEFDVNSFKILNNIKASSPDLIIFSGYGGQILKKKHIDLNIPYLHMHPGDIPTEKGSTTIYYSILNKKSCTVSAFLMNEKIDSGKIILKKNYSRPFKNVDIDNYYDNIIRANCMLEALVVLNQKNEYESLLMDKHLEYYIIHPVIKNISVLSLNDF